MIGLDSNVLVRYLAQDDPKQSALASRLIEESLTAALPGFISLVVLAELLWVLSRLYAASNAELIATAQDILDTPQFHVERRDVVLATIRNKPVGRGVKSGLVDALIAQLAKAEGCTHTVTFDKRAVRSAGMRLLG